MGIGARLRRAVSRSSRVDPRRVELESRRDRVAAEHGDWTAHNIHVGAGAYTRGDSIYGDELKLRRAVGLIEDLMRRPWSELRIADLGCNEGLYACEFAMRGASVVGVEGRASNIEKARFAKEALELENLELVHADVRSLSRERFGGFDVVLCWGLLYHLDTPELFRFSQQMREICDGVTIVDTQISLGEEDLRSFDQDTFWADPQLLGPLEGRAHEDREYWGRAVFEHPPESTTEQRLRSGWASLDNPESFWLTRPSLINLLADSGFATVLEVRAPRLAYPPDRVTLVAFGSGSRDLRAAPLVNDIPEAALDERPPRVPK